MADLERGDRIKDLREQRHLTQPVIADRVGVTLRAYQEWEAGGGIQWENAKRLAKVLTSTPDYIMSGEAKKTPELFAVNGDGDRLEQIQAALAEIQDQLNRLEAAGVVRDAEVLRQIAALGKTTRATRRGPSR